MSIVLDRLAITGSPDADTPLVVLLEIADAYDIDGETADELLRLVSAHRPSEVTFPFSAEDYKRIARFVNRHCEWDIDSLNEAFTFLQGYMTSGSGPLPQTTFRYGYQTPGDANKLNACVLYKLCRFYELPLTTTTSLSHMAMAIYMTVRDHEFRRCVMRAIVSDIRPDSLSHLFLMACRMADDAEDNIDSSDEGSIEEDYDELRFHTDVHAAVTAFGDKNTLLRRVTPRKNAEAVALAALVYDLDISKSRCPMEEYRLLQDSSLGYTPKDETLADMVTKNRFSLQLSMYFNPRLPHGVYNEESLQNLATQEGYRPEDFRQESAYSLLCTAYLSETFHHGKHLNIMNAETPIDVDDVMDISGDKIVCFGVKEGTLTAFTYKELADCLHRRRSFDIPLRNRRNDKFPTLALRKLRNLCRTIREGESVETIDERKRLERAIEIVTVFTEAASEAASARLAEFVNTYERANEDLQKRIRKLVTIFFHLSMYMRGWRGHEDDIYPVTSALIASSAHQAQVDINVSRAITVLEQTCKDLGVVGTAFMDLPLFKYTGIEFETCTEQDSHTVGERINIVKLGENYDNNNSCLRLSSNWFATSAWRYMKLLGMDEEFNVERLRHIS